MLILPIFFVTFAPPVTPAVHTAPKLPSGATSYTFNLGVKGLEFFGMDTYAPANTNIIQYTMTSNTNVTVALMTSSNFATFRTTRSGIAANSVQYQNGSSITQQTFKFGPGDYDFFVYAYGSAATVTLSFQVYPNNPLSSGPLLSPEPSGIASFGLTNSSGVDSPYAVRSTDVAGVADISSMEAINPAAESSFQVPTSSASLQLNSVLVVNEAGSKGNVYWIQNVPTFVTATTQVELADNLWNFSSSGFLSSSTVTGRGGVFSFVQDGSTQYYYDFEGTNATYTVPFGIVTLLNSTVQPGTGVLVQYGARIVDPGAQANLAKTDWYDNVTIHDPTVTSSYFLTSGNDTTPDGLNYDTEFVLGGDANGASTNFTSMSSGLGLYYTNGTTSHSLTAFPSYFSFGYDTLEAADNLRMAYDGNGQVSISTGAPNYQYLGTATGSSSLSSIESSLGFPSTTTTTTTSSSTPSTSSTTTSSTSTTTTTTTSTSSSSTGTSSSSTSTSTTTSTPTTSTSTQSSTSTTTTTTITTKTTSTTSSSSTGTSSSATSTSTTTSSPTTSTSTQSSTRTTTMTSSPTTSTSTQSSTRTTTITTTVTSTPTTTTTSSTRTSSSTTTITTTTTKTTTTQSTSRTTFSTSSSSSTTKSTTSTTTIATSSSGGKSSLAVSSQNTVGQPITGYWTVLYNGNGGTVGTGYTPHTYTLNDGQTYSLEADSYGSCQFAYWLDSASTNSVRTISITSDTQLTAVYNCGTGGGGGGNSPSVTIESVNQNGAPITGYWTVLYGPRGGQLATGYTTKTFGGLTSGTQYSVELDSYAGCQFSHWQGTNSGSDVRSFTASGAQTFVGVYTCTSTTATATALPDSMMMMTMIGAGEGLVSAVTLLLLAAAAISVTTITRRPSLATLSS
jgi:hypothetical protein